MTRLLTLGCAWMAVFGPSIESCSFILIAPALAWALADAWKPTTSSWSRHTLILVFGMFLVVYVTSWFRESRDWFYFLQPLAALLFFVERWLHALTNDPFTAAAPHALTSN